MIDWLRRDRDPPVIDLGGAVLPIEITRHRTARRLTLRLAPDGSAVRITLPSWCSAIEATAFARARSGWLAQQLAKLPAKRDVIAERALTYRGDTLPFVWEETAPRRPRLGDDGLRVGGPEDGLSARLQRWLEAEALRLFNEDAARYTAAAGLAPAQVKLTRAKRRWGSCSSERVLRLNWRLVQAPDAIRSSVVAHEVAHLVHFDHSAAFHALLGDLYEGDIGDANAWLSRHGRTLYCAFG